MYRTECAVLNVIIGSIYCVAFVVVAAKVGHAIQTRVGGIAALVAMIV